MLHLRKFLVGTAVVAVTLFVTGGAQAALDDALPPGMYTFERALALGILNPDDFTPPAGMEICPPYDATRAAVTDAAPALQTAPVCSINPVDLASSLHSRSHTESPSTASSFTELSTAENPCELTLLGTHRLNGVCDQTFRYRGGSMLTEVSDPSVCVSACLVTQHLYNRVAMTTPSNNAIEVGWQESNNPQHDTDGAQKVTTVTFRGSDGLQDVDHWGTLVPGNQYAFRADHCGAPGQLRVCMEQWNGSSWTFLRSWNQMRCLNSNGTFNCSADIFTELAAADQQSWFDLNGGADGLRTQNVEVKRDWWEIFDTSNGKWMSQSPYTICPVADFHHFTVFHGPPSC